MLSLSGFLSPWLLRFWLSPKRRVANVRPQALQTRHSGYLFRSRQESRTAVLLESLGVQYEYERQGYDLGRAGWYLPDFWLPDYNAWIEVKGAIPTTEERYRAKGLAALSYPVYIIYGGFWPGELKIIEIVALDRVYERIAQEAILEQNEKRFWCALGKCRSTQMGDLLRQTVRLFKSKPLGIVARDYQPKPSERIVSGRRMLDLCPKCEGLRFGDARYGFSDWCLRCKRRVGKPEEPHAKLMGAFIAARSARFEHEEVVG